MKAVRLRVRGNRDGAPQPLRGADVGIYAVLPDGSEHLLPVRSFTIRSDGRANEISIMAITSVHDLDIAGVISDANIGPVG